MCRNAAALVIGGLWAMVVAEPAPELGLADAGKTDYAIVIPVKAIPQEELAAGELRRYLRFMSGIELPIKPANEGPGQRIFVAAARGGKGPGGIAFTGDETEHDAFVVQTQGKDLYLVGSNKRAVLYAVYDFLEKELGCRWLTFGEWEQGQKSSGKYASDIEEHVPKLQRIVIPETDRREKASLKYRGFICAAWFGNTPAQMIDWMVKNKLNRVLVPADQYLAAEEWRKLVVEGTVIPRGLILSVGHHSFDYFLSRAKYFDKHPDWFPLVNGERYRGHRTDGQFCLSNPDAVKTYTENVMAYVKEHPEIDVLALYPNDGYGWCECDQCTKGRGMWEERPKYQAVQDNYLRLINPINEQVRRLYPAKRVGIAAYVNYCQPPSVVKPGPGLSVEYAFFTRNWFTVPWGDAEGQVLKGPYARDLNAEFLRRWVELTKENGGDVMMYEYYTGRSAWKGTGFYLMQLIADELAFFKKIGLVGCSVQAGYKGFKGKEANLYVFAKSAWNTEADTDAILTDYCKHRFGKAADPMLNYLKAAETNSREHLKYFVRGAQAAAAKEKNIAACQAFLDEARELADTQLAQKNVATEQENFAKLRKF